MRQEDFYSGEPITGSPANFSPYDEAVNNASFGKYYYDSSSRMMNPPVTINPGGYGYNSYYNPNPAFQQQPLYGIGSPYRYDMYGQPQYTTGYGPGPNPIFQQQSPLIQQETTFHVPGISFGSDYLPPVDYEEKIEELQRKYIDAKDEADAKRSVDMQGNPYYNPNMGYNYYGVPYYNPYQYTSINSEISQEVQRMKDEARENRIQLNIHLSKLAHNFIRRDNNIPDEYYEEMYRGKDIDIPQVSGIYQTPQESYEMARLSNMVPFDNSQIYRDHYMAVHREIQSGFPENANMNNCFDNIGILEAKWEMEEEMHRRRNGSLMYDNNTYRYYIKQRKAERYAQEKGIISRDSKESQINQFVNGYNANQMKQQALSMLPTLNENASIAEDGSLHITCNFGSHAGETYSVHNSQEAEYEQKRERFGSFIDSIPGAIYQNNHGGGNG